MKVFINGKESVFSKPVTVNELLNQEYVGMQQYITIQVNEDIISKDAYKTTLIKDGDVIEFLYYMGGGCK